MHYLCRNVNDAFRTLVGVFAQPHAFINRSPSRVGEVLRFNEPVIVTYTHPRERVLFNDVRDCNPFFHLFESLWMLAGRNDVAPLEYYNPRMREFSDDGTTLHGAYGHRWRRRFGWDQLEGIVRELIDNPTSRRCVLSMWNSCFHDDDRPGGEEDMEMVLNGAAKDVPCNTHAYFSVRDGCLDMTVCNRSNDLVWGMLGANAVHFSILQEYMATRIGVQVGHYHQMSNNLHVYTERFTPEEWLAWYDEEEVQDYPRYGHNALPSNIPLVEDPERFDRECNRFVDSIYGWFDESYLRYVAQPMMVAFRKHKQRQYLGDNGAMDIIRRVHAQDWRIAGERWLQRRKEKWEAKSRDRNPYTARDDDGMLRVPTSANEG